ncbi:MAG: LemA family protein [Bacilli bacterium]|nr:LemA family protein [Bacilli bacterium]
MTYLIIALIVIIIITVLVLMFISSKNKFTFLNIKINEADSNINLFLQKKAVGLDNIIKEIQQKKKDDGRFDDYIAEVDKQKDNYQLHSLLSKYYAKVTKILFDNESLAKDSEIIKYLTDLKANEEDLIGSIKFYNDTVVDYNGLINVFPHKLFAKILGNSEIEFYNNEKEELFDILK